MKVLILGVNGFIGSHLTEAILAKTDWQITAIDIAQNNIKNYISHERFEFKFGDITKDQDWVKKQIENCNIVLPLVAIATPFTYVNDPLKVFELDFEANLKIIRHCVELKKRIIFPSTSEVYGMCHDEFFDEETSDLITGPINKERWIYSSSKQLLDRIIYAYGKHNGLSYTLFRPFNWYGPRLDDIFNPKRGGSRVLTQFIGNILRGEDINLVNGGEQKRSFTYIDDGINALIKIIENKEQCAKQKIFNIGNPNENISIKDLAKALVSLIKGYPKYASNAENTKLIDISSDEYYGKGYQDVVLRVPAIKKAKLHLDWEPLFDIRYGLKKTLDYYLEGSQPSDYNKNKETF